MFCDDRTGATAVAPAVADIGTDVNGELGEAGESAAAAKVVGTTLFPMALSTDGGTKNPALLCACPGVVTVRSEFVWPATAGVALLV